MKKRFFAAICLIFSLAAAGCGAEKSDFTVTLAAGEGVSLGGSVAAELCDESGLSVGTAQLTVGETAFQKSTAPFYLSCTVGEEYDCPVVYADGKDLTVTVKRAEKDENGAYRHAYTLFLKGEDAKKDYALQICMAGEGGFCYTPVPFRNGAASMALADGDYDVEVILGGEIVYREALSFAYAAGPRYAVVGLEKA